MPVDYLTYTDSRRVVTAGDSMSVFGPQLGGTSVSQNLKALHTEIPWVDEAVGGTLASEMLYNKALVTRWAAVAATPIALIVTGTNSYFNDETGAAVYGQISDMAEALVTAGFAEVYATTCVPATLMNSAENTERLDGNSRIIADVDGFLTNYIDWAAESSLQVPGFDGTHFNATQRAYAATVCDAVMFP